MKYYIINYVLIILASIFRAIALILTWKALGTGDFVELNSLMRKFVGNKPLMIIYNTAIVIALIVLNFYAREYQSYSLALFIGLLIASAISVFDGTWDIIQWIKYTN